MVMGVKEGDADMVKKLFRVCTNTSKRGNEKTGNRKAKRANPNIMRKRATIHKYKH